MTTLLTIVSRQIWPQVLAVTHLKPERLFLLHSENPTESKEPAQRLKRFFEHANLVPGGVHLATIADTDFGQIETDLEDLQVRNKLRHEACVLNFTGGNKLMATAAFRWCARRSVDAFYLERRNQLTWFEPREGDILTRTETLDPHLTDFLDPVDLLICQLGSAVVKSRGERLTLAAPGRNGRVEDVQARLKQEFQARDSKLEFRKWLQIDCKRTIEPREGDALEYAVAVILLKLGVPTAYRSVELKPTESTPFTEGELDLVFNWGGRLWVVDCKDKASGKLKLDNLKTALLKEGVNISRVQKHLDRLSDELSEKDIKVLREDLQQIAEVGGLLGSSIAVRSAGLPPQAVEYARTHRPHVEVIYKNELAARLRTLLRQNEKATAADLSALKDHFRK
jgi:hypothetical protein